LIGYDLGFWLGVVCLIYVNKRISFGLISYPIDFFRVVVNLGI